MVNKKKKQSPSELRMDLVSNDWVIVATGRARRPETFAKHSRKKGKKEKQECPFCQEENLKEKLARRDKENGEWFIVSIPNKYPALSPNKELQEYKIGPNRTMDGMGYHEVIVTADHNRQMAQFNQKEMEMVVDLYQSRYIELINQRHIKYVSIFHNHGKEAGASVAHPHSQLMAIPVLDPDLRHSLDGAESFYRSQGKCVYCTMIEWDLKDKQRIVYENDQFVVLCPFASQIAFETRIYPKNHESYFEKMTEYEKTHFADAFRVALNKIYKGLNDPAYNFYLHTAPSVHKSYSNYHWHINILPKTSTWAGFELGVGIEISIVEPEKAAEFLRKQ